MSDSVADWQHRLDREFPHGVVASWDDGDKRSAVYLLPRVYVTGVQGDYPVVWATAFAGSDKTLGPWPVTSYEIRNIRPRLAVVTFTGLPHPMQWATVTDDKLQLAMAPVRAEAIAAFPDGGREVFHRDEGTDLP